jgi:putative ABC transport system substrate-binding protein
MRRREFITLFAGTLAWPLAAGAQQPIPVIGLLSSRSPTPDGPLIAVIRRGLSETGFVEGQNVTIDYRWAEAKYDRLPPLAYDLARRQVAVMVAIGGNPAALAAKTATTRIPIVFTTQTDPLKLGLVASLNRPGGNITGVSTLANALVAKQLDLLGQLIPIAMKLGLLVDPDFPDAEAQTRDAQEAAAARGQKLIVVAAGSKNDLEAAFTTLLQERIAALIVPTEPFFFSRREQLAALALRHAVPAIYAFREYAEAGGLISYGTSLAEAYRQVGMYTGRILKGEKPAELPIIQSTKFELVINTRTAKALGLDIPDKVLALADEVIE